MSLSRWQLSWDFAVEKEPVMQRAGIRWLSQRGKHSSKAEKSLRNRKEPSVARATWWRKRGKEMRAEGSSGGGHISSCSSQNELWPLRLMHWKALKGLWAKASILWYLIFKMSPLAACGDWIVWVKRGSTELLQQSKWEVNPGGLAKLW